MTTKEKIITRLLATSSIRGDISGRGTLLTDYDKPALGVLVDAAAEQEALRAGLHLEVDSDGQWILTDDEGDPFDDKVLTLFEGYVADRALYLSGAGAPTSTNPTILTTPKVKIRPHWY